MNTPRRNKEIMYPKVDPFFAKQAKEVPERTRPASGRGQDSKPAN
jgi:hypothetical protein